MAETTLTVKDSDKLSASVRFTEKVMAEFRSASDSKLAITESQKQLIQGYFITIDGVLKAAEIKRLEKNAKNTDHEYDELLPYSWQNVNLETLALDCFAMARIGLDMLQRNQLWAIPYKNKRTNKYDITLMQGYSGIELIAKKYAHDVPIADIEEVIYSNDVFKPVKRSLSHEVEGYEFEITNPFDRGEIVGVFGYLIFEDQKKNKLVIMNKKDVEKRKPKYASAQFWGGKGTEYENGQKKEVDIEGWLDEMYLKTMKRELFSSKYLPIDSAKIDDAYRVIKLSEVRSAETEVQNEIDGNACKELIDKETGEIKTGEIPQALPEQPLQEEAKTGF